MKIRRTKNEIKKIKEQTPPKCGAPNCDNLVYLTKLNKWALYCSTKCRGIHNSLKSREKTRNTMQERYGATNTLKSEELKTKFKKTMQERYGVEYAMQSEELKNKLESNNIQKYGRRYTLVLSGVRDKRKKTMQERYGVEYPTQNKQIVEKIKNNNIQKYGVNCTFDLLDRKAIAKKNSLSHVNDDNIKLLNDISELEQMNKSLSISQMAKKLNVGPSYIYQKFKTNNILFKKYYNSSTLEDEIKKFIYDQYNNILLDSRIKSLIGKELDIFLPEFNLAIECNGTYWHSENSGKDKNYHLNKTEKCIEKGIKLLHIWQHDWIFHRPIIKSIILSNLKLTKTLYARKTQIKQLDKKEEKEFFNKNHIQGYVNSKICYGLIYEGNIVAAMSFGKSRYNKNYEWELLRFANILNTTVVGGAEKLFKKFIINKSPKNIISYCHRHLFSGNVYNKIGFKFLRNSPPSYNYTNDYMKLHSRIQFQKHKLKDKLEIYDSNLTEWENMQANGWDRIWDCGTSIWEYHDSII